ncbi:MAG: hypothetical protein V4549_07470 [Bacteroidota bacterium]
MKEVKFDIRNFSLANTPPIMQKIGDLGLVASAIGVAILAVPDTMMKEADFTIVLPHFAIVTAKALIGLGVLTKIVSKCFGIIVTTINGVKQ